MKKAFALLTAFLCMLWSVCYAATPQSGYFSETGYVNIYGHIDNPAKYDDVAILLLDNDGNPVYADETDASDNGDWRFSFKFNGDASKYSLKVRQGKEDVTASTIKAVTRQEAITCELDVNSDEFKTAFTANVSNWYNVSGKEYKIITAHYDKNGALLKASMSEVKQLGFGENISEHNFEIPENSARAKVFVWESTEKLIPLCTATELNPAENDISSLSIQVGADESSRRFVWYNNIETAGARLQYALKSDYEADGGFTSENSTVVKGTLEVPYGNKESVSCKAEVSGLTLGETYVYRVGDRYGYDNNVYEFNTYKDLEKKQSFAFVSDIHMLRRDYATQTPESVQKSINNWNYVLQRMTEYSPNLGFVVSTGDNVSSYDRFNELSDEERRYIGELEHETLFAAPLMKSIPFASTMGNHEATWAYNDTNFDWNYTSVTGYHYNLPNDDEVSGHLLNDSMGNFYFRSGDVLVIGINDMAREGNFGAFKNITTAINEAYIKKACDANTDANWRIIVNHVPPYAYGTTESETKRMREAFDDYCDKYDIDAVFTGHSHMFSRSKQIYANAVTDDVVTSTKDENGCQTASVTNPKGTVYYNTPSAMGHSFASTDADYKDWLNAWGLELEASKQISGFDGVTFSSGMFINVDTDSTGENLKMVINTVRSDNLQSVDEYTIYKTK